MLEEQCCCAEGLITHLRTFLNAEELIHKYRVREQDFTRKRKLPFKTVIGLVLQGGKQPLQARVNEFFKALGDGGVRGGGGGSNGNEEEEEPNTVTASAFYQARQKILPECFRALNKEIVGYFYDHYPRSCSSHNTGLLLKTWQGHRVLAIDGSCLNLPDTDELRQAYSVQGNQYRDATCVQALVSCLYDVLNEVPINVGLGTIQAEKNFIFEEHARFWDLQQPDVVVYDRLYVDYSVLSFHSMSGTFFVVRCPRASTFKAVSEFLQSDQTDRAVALHVTRRQKDFVTTHGLPPSVVVRLVKIPLSDGTCEVLMTSLLDRTRYPPEALRWLYQQRWGVETYFDRLKNLLEVERFSSTKRWGILQDFYALILFTSLESVLCKEVDAKLAVASHDKGLKYVYKVNKSVSYHALSLFLIELFQDHQQRQAISRVLESLFHFFRQKPLPIRPGRRYPRRPASPRRQVRYLRYEKRVWA